MAIKKHPSTAVTRFTRDNNAATSLGLMQNQRIHDEIEKYGNDENFTFVERLLNRSVRKAIKEERLQRIRTFLEGDRAKLELEVKAEVLAVEARLDEWVKFVKVKCQTDFAEFVTGERERLGSWMHERQRNFLALVREKTTTYEEFKNTPAGPVYHRAMIEEIERFFDFLNNICFNLENVINDKLRTS